MSIWILIFVVATGSTSQTGSAAVAPEFTSYDKCMKAGTVSAADARSRGNVVVALACVEK